MQKKLIRSCCFASEDLVQILIPGNFGKLWGSTYIYELVLILLLDFHQLKFGIDITYSSAILGCGNLLQQYHSFYTAKEYSGKDYQNF